MPFTVRLYVERLTQYTLSFTLTPSSYIPPSATPSSGSNDTQLFDAAAALASNLLGTGGTQNLLAAGAVTSLLTGLPASALRASLVTGASVPDAFNATDLGYTVHGEWPVYATLVITVGNSTTPSSTALAQLTAAAGGTSTTTRGRRLSGMQLAGGIARQTTHNGFMQAMPASSPWLLEPEDPLVAARAAAAPALLAEGRLLADTSTSSTLASAQQPTSTCGTTAGLGAVQYLPPPTTDADPAPPVVDLGPPAGEAVFLSWPYDQAVDPVCLTRPINVGDVLSSSASGLISDTAASTRQVGMRRLEN